ncbi:hypothetical protein [Methylotetracoccus oryzae]|uniref:hypothetical protein n=1 Tax=Methylotetracoccus oryzae TaxID=1919059 RepID=UPI00111A68FE|nr:hypothetical protein [Methylotetracoccus oryzae]
MNTKKQWVGARSGPLWLATAALALTASTFMGAARAVDDPDGVSFTLEGCRNDGTITLPIGGKFVCPDGAYTTGNLGKGWNELDLVPFRITAAAGNSAPTTQNYAVSIALDNLDVGKPGYDVLASDNQPSGAPVLNTSLSDASCTPLTATAQQTLTPGVGGIDKTIYRILTITQPKNTTCVYDWYGRLALGSHLFPGSSLHANLLNQNLGTAGIGSKDVSIPVKEISPQELRKDMSAKQNADHAWNLTKAADPASVSFGDVCAAGFSDNKQVTFRVEWEKVAATPGMITVVTNIYAKNPAARAITVNVTDNIYKGTTQTDQLATANSGNVSVPANTELKVFEHTATLPNTAGNIGHYLNDVAKATYTDEATGIPVPGQTEARASAQIISGIVTNTSADISDSESLTGAGLTFSVAAPTIGSFLDAYIPGTATVGPVKWEVLAQKASGSVDFAKTLYLDKKRVTSGTLSDTAKLSGSDGFTKTAGPISVAIDSSASVQLSFTKKIPNVLETGEKIEVIFHISRNSDLSYSRDETITFSGSCGGGSECTSNPVVLTGLVPDSYTVMEKGSVFYPAGCTEQSCTIADPLASDNPSQTANLSLGEGGTVSKCSATLAFENRLREEKFAKAKVAKVTDPTLTSGEADYDWTFTLNPGGHSATAGAGAAPVFFKGGTGEALLLAAGTYTVTETTKTGWDLTKVLNPDGTTTTVNPCTFTVDYPEDYDKTFTCTFTNTKRAKVDLVKTVQSNVPTGTQAYTFEIREGASTTSDGKTLETKAADAANGGEVAFTTLLKPGTYQFCEVVMPGWNTNLGTYGPLFVPNSIIPPTLPNPNVNNMTVCVDFTATAGETKSFAVDNAPPPGGMALTIGFWKNWASCANSKGSQAWVLDNTMHKATLPGIMVGGFYLKGVDGAEVEDPKLLTVTAPDCSKAVALLNKSTFDGKKKASDPLFNMAAQLVAAELNLTAGAYTCPDVVLKVQQANALLVKYGFNGNTYSPKLTAADATGANNLAKYLDDYNNNRTGVCP